MACHIVAGILCVPVINRTNVDSNPLAAVGAYKRLPSDMYLILFMLYGSYVRLSCIKLSGIYLLTKI